MRKFIYFMLTLSLMGVSRHVAAQDLLVTTAGDSINCRITRQHNGVVYFNYLKDQRKTATLIAAKQVSIMIQGYYGEAPVGARDYKVKTDYSRWRYGVHAGYSYRIGKVSDQFTAAEKEYLKKLKSGFVVGGDIHYFFSESIGLGVIYNLNKHKAKYDNDLSDNIAMQYIGASILNRYLLVNRKKHIVLGFNLGYQSYRDKAVVLGEPFDIQGGTFAAGLEAGYEQELGPGSLLFVGLGYKAGTLTKVKLDGGAVVDLTKEDYESLGRLEVTVGVKFGK